MNDDDFTLGETILDDDFSLGEAPTELPENTVEPIDESKNFYNQFSEADKKEVTYIYDLLVKDKPPKVKFKVYFYTNINIFEVAGVAPFNTLSTTEYDSFCQNVDKWIGIANLIWLRNEEDKQKILELNDALEELKSIFKYEKLTKEYSNAIKKYLRNELAKFIYSKFIKDRVLDISELLEAMDYAITLKYTGDREEAKKAVTTIIQLLKEKYKFSIESYEDSFLNKISKKDKIELLDTEQTKQKLFKEYKPLAELNAQVTLQELPSDDSLFEEMTTLLSEHSVLIPNTDFFILDFLEPEIERQIGHYDFDYPINTEYYYYLKGTAINNYQLTEDQWRELALIRRIIPEDAATVAFIMGDKKAASISGIASLLQDNPETAYSRIISGDLETYFKHIGRNSIANKISGLKEAYKTNVNELVTGVVSLLTPVIDAPVLQVKTDDSFDELIKKDASVKELVSYVINHKSDETLYMSLTTETVITERIETLLLAKNKKITYTKFLLNILNELLIEIDISQYQYAFIKMAIRIQDLLLEKDNYITFTYVYYPIIQKALELLILKNESEIPNLSDNYKIMKQKAEEEQALAMKKTHKKSLFGFKKKGE